VEKITAIKPNPEKRVRFGLKRCAQCKGQFTVRMGTIFEESKLPMTKWLKAIFLMCSSKKGVSAHQLHRTLETTYKTAWFLAHRIREAMRAGELAPFGHGGGPVEVDETYIGRDPDEPIVTSGVSHKMKVLSLIDRDTGRGALRRDGQRDVQGDCGSDDGQPVAGSDPDDRRGPATTSRSASSSPATATSTTARRSTSPASTRLLHANTVEGLFSIFNRGMRGVYQHCAKKHLHRYLAEFDFRYSNRVALGVDDHSRSVIALQGVVGKADRPEGS
jgi:hypothetical protein